MEQTRPPEEFVSSRPSAARPRAWRALAACLAALLLVVVAVGLWARWRPLSDDDAARLRALSVARAVRTDLHPDASVLPGTALDRQVDALGPAATPSQVRRLGDRGNAAPAVSSLDDAADQLRREAGTVRDGDLASTMASVAASWWAASVTASGSASSHSAAQDPASSGNGSPGSSGSSGSSDDSAVAGDSDSTGASSARGTDKTSTAASPEAPASPTPLRTSECETTELAAVTALDRAAFTAEAAQARLSPGAAADAVAAASAHGRDLLREDAVAPLLSCDPRPVAARYELPSGFHGDPAAAAGEAQHEATEAVVRAVAASSPEERDWWWDALRSTSRDAQRLDPEQPVAALPGRD